MSKRKTKRSQYCPHGVYWPFSKTRFCAACARKWERALALGRADRRRDDLPWLNHSLALSIQVNLPCAAPGCTGRFTGALVSELPYLLPTTAGISGRGTLSLLEPTDWSRLCPACTAARAARAEALTTRFLPRDRKHPPRFDRWAFEVDLHPIGENLSEELGAEVDGPDFMDLFQNTKKPLYNERLSNPEWVYQDALLREYVAGLWPLWETDDLHRAHAKQTLNILYQFYRLHESAENIAADFCLTRDQVEGTIRRASRIKSPADFPRSRCGPPLPPIPLACDRAETVRTLLAAGHRQADIARALGVSRAAVSKRCKVLKNQSS